MRAAGGTKPGVPRLVAVVTKPRMASLVLPSLQDGRGSPAWAARALDASNPINTAATTVLRRRMPVLIIIRNIGGLRRADPWDESLIAASGGGLGPSSVNLGRPRGRGTHTG